MTDVDLITFAQKDSQAETQLKLQDFWKDRPVNPHLIEYGERANAIEAALAGRFQFGTMVELSALSSVLDELNWDNPNHLLVFDDIVLAPFALKYGRNAILSPHDCISKMNYSHFRLSPVGLAAAKYYSRHLIARRYEKRYYHLALLVHLITHEDRIWMQQINSRARYHVIPNADLLNPGFVKTEPCPWDIMVWGDLRISSIARGAKEFIRMLAQDWRWVESHKIILIGRVSRASAERIIGEPLLSTIAYSPLLEDKAGRLQHAKITVVPDIGGAGTKNRCVNLLSSGKCLACLYPQMEGIDKACDQGAINASNMEELVFFVKRSLEDGSYLSISEKGETIFKREYNLESIRQLWNEMVQRALSIRNRLGGSR